jgi:hypothetical protein
MIGCGPSTPDSNNSGTTAPEQAAAPSAAPVDAGDTQQVSIHVPKMHCPFACWPAIKKTLEEQEGVAEVTLAQQAEEGKIDNPRVLVSVNDQFDGAGAVEALAAAGFSDSVVEGTN